MESEIRNKRKVDRISALPDFLIQHILSFLPSTKESIHTCILSKRWKDQWACVPVLIFKSSDMSDEKFFEFTENVLLSYDSVKIKKFYIEYGGDFKQDPLFSAKIRFATRRNVEELILKFNGNNKHMLPEFIFKHAPLVKLQTVGCTLKPENKVSWECLKELSLSDCILPDQAIESVLSGSPLLESLELRSSFESIGELRIVSKSLKRVVLVDLKYKEGTQISCPNIEELTIWGHESKYILLSNHGIKHMISTSPLLKSLELRRCSVSDQLDIASKSLRRLFLKEFKASVIDISCPNIMELKLEDLKDVGTLKLTEVPSSVSFASDLTINLGRGSVEWKRIFSSRS